MKIKDGTTVKISRKLKARLDKLDGHNYDEKIEKYAGKTGKEIEELVREKVQEALRA